MAAVASLQTELKNLGALAKRHNAELLTSSEKSISILEAVSQSFDNDQTIISNLRKYEDFSTPFILACSEASAKSCASALQCIQTLATYKAISPARLPELLQALKEATQLGLGIQLKVLQVLPVIMYEFAADLTGSQVVELLQVCAELLSSNKVATIHNAAYATLQQLVTCVFDTIDIRNPELSDDLCKLIVDPSEEVTFKVPFRLYNAAMIWVDLANMAEERPAQFLGFSKLPVTFILELYELTISTQSSVVRKHPELIAVLKTRIIPLLLRLFSENAEFSTCLRVVRIFYLLVKLQLEGLTTELEVILSLLAHNSSGDTNWRRVICLEVLHGVLSEPNLLLQLYEKFDGDEGRLNVLEAITNEFAKSLSDEKRLMLASDMEKEAYDAAISEKASLSDAHTDDSGTNGNLNDSFILTKNVVTKVPLIEMLDRASPPSLQPAYTHYLILKCINSLADDIHRLASVDKVHMSPILNLLSTPILKCYSIALGLAMDLELFRLVVRAVQRLAHASGIESAHSLRDEFIMLLAQYSYIPEETADKPWILGRCSLCVRALFNLGFALGNQLETSWNLITGVIFRLDKQIVKKQEASIANLFGNDAPEYRNMNAALKKLIESTSQHNDQAIVYLMEALDLGNADIKYLILQHILEMNLNRFSDSRSRCWESLAEILLKGIAEHHILPLKVLNDSSIILMDTWAVSKQNPAIVDGGLTMILRSICRSVAISPAKLKTTQLQQLNLLIDKFGSKVNTGWEHVFETLSEIPSTENLEVIRAAFLIIELICSDFLDKLPYPCIFSLCICLNEFSLQQHDLNTSFTSTSLFWSVCDHLIAHRDGDADIDANLINEEDDLVKVARDYESKTKQIALWLLAVSKLASISEKVQQQQVKASAVQIFLRLYNTHGPRLPTGVWETSHKLILPKLLSVTKASSFGSASEQQEVYILVIDGTSRLLNMPSSIKSRFLGEFFEVWVSFLNGGTSISAAVTGTIYRDLKLFVEAQNTANIPLKSISNFILAQDSLPSYSKDAPKATADSLQELVSLCCSLHYERNELSLLKLVAACAVYPYYTTKVPSSDMSSLQLECTNALERVDPSKDATIYAEYAKLLNKLALSPYEPADGAPPSSPPDFKGLSKWSLRRLSYHLESLDLFLADAENEKPLIADAVLEVHRGMNRVSSYVTDSCAPTQITLQILKSLPSLDKLESSVIVDSVKLALEWFNSKENVKELKSAQQIISILDEFVDVLKSKFQSEDGWRDTLALLMRQSVVYERSIHNLKFYDHVDTSLEKALTFGIADIPRPLHNQEVSFYCLKILNELGSDSKFYSDNAKIYFSTRVRAILCQYIGDCKLLGREPLRLSIYEELLVALKNLKDFCTNNKESDEKLREIILHCMFNAHHQVIPLLQDVLMELET